MTLKQWHSNDRKSKINTRTWVKNKFKKLAVQFSSSAVNTALCAVRALHTGLCTSTLRHRPSKTIIRLELLKLIIILTGHSFNSLTLPICWPNSQHEIPKFILCWFLPDWETKKWRKWNGAIPSLKIEKNSNWEIAKFIFDSYVNWTDTAQVNYCIWHFSSKLKVYIITKLIVTSLYAANSHTYYY